MTRGKKLTHSAQSLLFVSASGLFVLSGAYSFFIKVLYSFPLTHMTEVYGCRAERVCGPIAALDPWLLMEEHGNHRSHVVASISVLAHPLQAQETNWLQA